MYFADVMYQDTADDILQVPENVIDTMEDLKL
jgi:hypothetical protein